MRCGGATLREAAAVQDKPKDTIAFVALTVFVAQMYAVPGEWIAAMEPLRLALVSSAVAALMVGIRRLGKAEPLVLDGYRGGALICLTLLAFASMLWSVNPAVSRFTAIELAKLTAIYLTIVNVVTTARRLAIVAGAMVLASIVTSIGVIDWYFAGVDLIDGFRARWVGVYADPNHMAMNLCIILPLAVAFLARKQTPWVMRALCLAAAVLSVVAIVYSHSRGGFIGLSVAMVLWAMREKRRLQAVGVGLLFFIGLLLFAPDSFWKRNETVTEFEEDASAMGRVYAWQVAAAISQDRPLLGVGAGSFQYAWPLYAPAEAGTSYVAHNVFLDVIGELGFVGLLLFLIFTGSAAAGAFEVSGASRHAWLARAFGAAAAAYLVCDLFSGYLLSSHFYVLFGFAASIERIIRAERAAEAAGELSSNDAARTRVHEVINAT